MGASINGMHRLPSTGFTRILRCECFIRGTESFIGGDQRLFRQRLFHQDTSWRSSNQIVADFSTKVCILATSQRNQALRNTLTQPNPTR
jgi:hypothetical protein